MEIDDEMIKSKGEEEDKKKPIVVILVGAPGSGKSTFCDHVMRVSTRPWVRVCQDTIGNGKAGTKAQCLAISNTSLKEGKNILIDRCNLDKEQRADFVNLKNSHQVDIHAIVLDLPAKLCISRCVNRTGHEGNLQGGRAAAVVNRMLQKKESPKINEGFTRITFCYNENDVQSAMDTYGSLSSINTLPSGCFGEKKSDSKVQVGIMKFLKRVDAPSKLASNKTDKTEKTDKTTPGPSNDNTTQENHPVNEGKEKKIPFESGTHDGVPTLAFPSISTSDFQFNIEKASEIIVETVEEFVNKIGNGRLVLVDLSHGSKILSLVKTKAAKKNIDSKKFFTFVGDITKLHSGGLKCNVIANAANWRLKPGGGGVNAAIFDAAGPDLDTATKQRAGSLTPGKAITIPLPSTSPLFSKEGVTHVIHVLGPNMNPKRPNCLKDDYQKGCKVLKEAYMSLFGNFESIVRNQEKLCEHFDGVLNSGVEKVRREDDGICSTEKNKKFKGFVEEKEIGGKVNKDWGSWAQALYKIAMNPEKHGNDVIEILDDVVVLNDVYPKAQKHVLVVARVKGLESLSDVGEEHLPILRTMHDVGLKWAQTFLKENESLVFRLGYHSAPSMRQLHLHVISQDFDSKHLKNKKHWNSFNSSFFRDSVDVIEEVREEGKPKLNDDEKFMSMELRCNRCRSAHPNIPRLKSHIAICKSPFPENLLQNGRLLHAPTKV
ncbi:transcription factor bHLH140 [Lactuca sativa]|uniref:transcription factor bHLH140 n=1 Tax=Lactuca sativa TaxID=4236 RepID=UPI000CB7D0A3|nr:transcription factor bHLH140 [Lactuca sativa]